MASTYRMTVNTPLPGALLFLHKLAYAHTHPQAMYASGLPLDGIVASTLYTDF